jgi:hypothetical protein
MEVSVRTQIRCTEVSGGLLPSFLDLRGRYNSLTAGDGAYGQAVFNRR